MINVNELPDLVIFGILPYLGFPNERFETFNNSLVYIHISSRLRHLSISLVYKTIYVRFVPSNEWKSNIGLIVELGMEKLVKDVEVYSDEENIDMGKPIGPLLDNLNLGNVDWPQKYTPQLSNKLLATMSDVLQNFALHFPHVLSVGVSLSCASGTSRQFTSQLVTTFYDQLVILKLAVNAPIGLEYFPASRRHLEIVFQEFAGYSMPKIRNPGNLRILELANVPYNFNWEDLVETQPVLSNLHTLVLGLDDNSFDQGVSNGIPTQKAQLQLPRLVDLLFIKPYASNRLKFDPKIVASHQFNVYLDLSFKELDDFGKLPIKYICHLFVNL